MYLSPDRVASNDRFGSCADLRHHLALRPVCGDKPTFSPERRLGSDTPRRQPQRHTAAPGSPGQTASTGSGYTLTSGCPTSATASWIVSARTNPSPSEGLYWSAAMEKAKTGIGRGCGAVVNDSLTACSSLLPIRSALNSARVRSQAFRWFRCHGAVMALCGALVALMLQTKNPSAEPGWMWRSGYEG